MAIGPWLAALDFYGAKETVGLATHANVVAYSERFLARPAVIQGRKIPPREASGSMIRKG
jgi:GST-like protein